MTAKVRYLVRQARGFATTGRRACLNCGSSGTVVVRKYLITALRRCKRCKLYYRTPTDPPRYNEKFYNGIYTQGFTTELPSEAQLEVMKARSFEEYDKCYPYYLSCLKALHAGPRLFEFGSSWGYGPYQLKAAGFNVTAYEISRARSSFSRRNLDVDAVDDFEEFVARHGGEFDVFFAAHVLEHVPSPSKVIRDGFTLLKPGGLLLLFVPNGSDRFRKVEPRAWTRLWGEVHPNFLDEEYLEAALGDVPRMYGTSPVEIPEDVDERMRAPMATYIDDLERYELMVVARRM